MECLPASYTDHIGRKAAENICHAFDYAKHIGRPLDHYVTINLRSGQDERMATVIFKMIRHKFRDWVVNAMKRHQADLGRPAYVYALEAPDEGHPHAHWVVHVPPILADEFLEKLPKWVIKARGSLGQFDVLVERVDPYTDKSLAKYIIKGTDDRYVGYLHLQEYAAPQGRIWGRRATASPAIGRAARRKAGFVPRRDRHKWKSTLLAAE